jgi:hypothetical protein
MSYDAYDRRMDSLVMETQTLWDPELAKLSPEDKAWLSRAIHAAPEKAAKIHYERSHTGFVREITVTVADVERLYQERLEA